MFRALVGPQKSLYSYSFLIGRLSGNASVVALLEDALCPKQISGNIETIRRGLFCGFRKMPLGVYRDVFGDD